MFFLVHLVGFASIVTISGAISTDCIASSKHVVNLHGPLTHITAWVGNSSDILNLTLEYGKGYPYDYDYIEVKHSNIVMKIIREKEETRIQQNIAQSFNRGWLDLDFIANKKYGFNFTSQRTYYELIGESEMKFRKFTVSGSNITINCKYDSISWKVVNSVTFIPLKPNSTNVFSFFSRSEFQPKLTAGNSSIELGFLNNVMNDVQHFKDIHAKPLPKYIEHMVKILCMPFNYCIYQLGVDETITIKKLFSKRYTSLAINGKGEMFVIKLRRSNHERYLPFNKDTSKTSTLPSISANDASLTAVITMGVVLAIVISAAAFLVIYIIRRQQKDLAVDLLDDMKKPMLFQTKPSRSTHSSNSSIASSGLNIQTQTRLWDAVVHNNQALVKHLLESGKNPANREIGMPTSPLEEAHLLGHKEIVKMFANKLSGTQSVPSQDQIEFTLKELEKRMAKVFQAAEYGLYERGNGVNVLLKTHSLPGTIKDRNGWSLMHYIAAVKFSDERPAWEPVDIRNFFEHHFFYINAIDHWGDTPLHILAQHQGSTNIMWDGQTISVENAWIEMAKIFISYGADPRIPNHQNILPQDLATISGCHCMAAYLKERCEELGDIDHASAAEKFDELVKAAKKNEFNNIVNLLKNHVPMLPIFAQSDPLVEAIRSGHQDVVFLLICAGSPMSNCSIDDLTPLEAAHNTLGLPALYPALMRKIYSDRLKYERQKIIQTDDIHQSLCVGLQNIQKSIRKIGYKSRWAFTSENDKRSCEAKNLLVAASGLGLSLTIQLLGLEDVELRPLPNEDSPVDKAQEGCFFDTLYVLCRDLKMIPHATQTTSKLLKRLENDLRIAECNIFSKYALIDQVQLLTGLNEYTVQTFLEQATNQKESDQDLSLYSSGILYVFARYGLIYLLDTYRRMDTNFEVDQVIQKFSNSTLLHISVFFGQQHITEYLLYHGASPIKLTIGGYSAAHVAAIVGDKRSMNYIISYMECKSISTEDKCNLGMTASELIDQYDKMRNNCLYPFLKIDDARNVKNEISESDMALEILRRKSKMLHIKNKDHLIQKVQGNTQNMMSKISPLAHETSLETQTFFQEIGKGFFKGNLKECGQHAEHNIIFQSDILRFTYEIENYSAYGDSKNVKIDTKNNKVIVDHTSNTDEKTDIFYGNNFIKKFNKTIQERIQSFVRSNAKVNLAPPFYIPYASGVVLVWAYVSDNNLNKVRVFIDPVIKADLPETNGIKRFPERIQKLCENISVELQVTNLKGDWTYRGYSLETSIFGQLNDNERTVWQICRYIKLISKRYWWASNSNIRKPLTHSDGYSVGVDFPKERALKSLFLSELADYPDKWEKSDIFDRVKGIYFRCLTVDNKEYFHNIQSVKSFLLPDSHSDTIPASIIGVYKYLEELSAPSPFASISRNPSTISYK